MLRADHHLQEDCRTHKPLVVEKADPSPRIEVRRTKTGSERAISWCAEARSPTGYGAAPATLCLLPIDS